jgi:ubiquitin carboxyl-terminal hydrolase 9/13
MFNTTEDAEEPDRLYELYAVVIHIGGNAYHGHYVSVIKTEDRGWLLFDDELVEPVDKHYVRNFFGDKPGMACAYVLFYQETTFEKVRAEQEAEGLEEVRIVSEKADVAQENDQANGHTNGLSRQVTLPSRPADEPDALLNLPNLDHVATAPVLLHSPTDPTNPVPVPPTPVDEVPVSSLPTRTKSVKEGKKEAKAQEKARKQVEKDEWKAKRKQREESYAKLREARKTEDVQMKQALEESKRLAAEEKEKQKEEDDNVPALNRTNRGSKSMSRKSFGFLRGKRDSIETSDGSQNGEGSTQIPVPDRPEPFNIRKSFSFGIGRKKSTKFPSS